MDWQRAMALALEEASAAAACGDVPVGAVLLDAAGQVVSRNRNRREADHDPTAHAEMLVLREAAAKLGGWRLLETTLVVTLEPCAMCAGAMVMARIQRVVFGTRDPKSGAVVSLYQITQDSRLNHQVEVVSGIKEEECAEQLKRFFQARRKASTVK
ncbi:MAG: tRNA adenosine(34) deaminase TadA [Firmicutes bacterium]|nr:tRNA adenosine(34) deaminase TadA [Bacillota bacterium]